MKFYKKGIVVTVVACIFILLYVLLCRSIKFGVSKGPVVGKSNNDGTITYNGETYYKVQTNASCVEEFGIDKFLGKLDSGSPIYTIKYDDKCYLCVTQWDSRTVYSRTNEEFKKGNKITSIYLGDYAERRITNEKDCQTLLSLNTVSGEKYAYKIDGSGRFSKSIFGCYDNSAIATEWIGTIAHKDNKWIFVSYEESSKVIPRSSPNRLCTGIIINDINLIKELERIVGNINQ